jgi:hypothetical protein
MVFYVGGYAWLCLKFLGGSFSQFPMDDSHDLHFSGSFGGYTTHFQTYFWDSSPLTTIKPPLNHHFP